MFDSKDSIVQAARVPLVVGVTGHRYLPTETGDDGTKSINSLIVNEVREFFDRLLHDYPETPLIVLSAFSPGADCLVAKIALEAGDRDRVRVIPTLPVPCDEHIEANRTALKDHYPLSVEEFEALLKDDLTEEPIVMPDVNCDQAERLAGVTSIPHLLAGVFAARHCQILLALWDGERDRSGKGGGYEIGGTAQNVHFHRTGELPRDEELEACLRDLDEPFAVRRSLLEEPETGLVYHVDTRNVKERKPHERRFLGREGSSEKDRKDYVDRFKKIYKNINAFNGDASKLLPSRKEKLTDSVGKLFDKDEFALLRGSLQKLGNAYAAADVLAVHFRNVTHRTMAAIFWLVGIAAASFLYYAHMAGPEGRYWLLGGYMLLLAVAIVLYLVVRERSFQDKYQDYRALAEGLRVQFFWRLAGLSSCASDHYLRKHKNELDWIRGAVRSCALRPEETLDDERLESLQEWWLKEQRNYFASASVGYHHRRLRFREIGGGVLLISFALSIYVLLESPTKITQILGLVAALVLFALIVFNLIEIARETEELLEEENAAPTPNVTTPRPRKFNWKKTAARLRKGVRSLMRPFALPYAISLFFSSYYIASNLKSRGIYRAEINPAKLLSIEILPGVVVLVIGCLNLAPLLLHLAHSLMKRFKTKRFNRRLKKLISSVKNSLFRINLGPLISLFNRRPFEKLISSLKNSLYGINLGLLIMLALLHSHAILPEFLSHLLKQEADDLHDMLVSAMGLMALVAALLHTYAERRALAQQQKLCKRMKEVFGRAQKRLDGLKTTEALELMLELGKEALEEQGDWLMLHRERPIELPRAEI